jgi:hypothetical protein
MYKVMQISSAMKASWPMRTNVAILLNYYKNYGEIFLFVGSNGVNDF